MSNSVCKVPGYLHDFEIVDTSDQGVLERCAKCGTTVFFKNDYPNHMYLSFHGRSVLQQHDKRFHKEYSKQDR